MIGVTKTLLIEMTFSMTISTLSMVLENDVLTLSSVLENDTSTRAQTVDALCSWYFGML